MILKIVLSLALQGVSRKKHQSLLIFLVLLISFTFAIVIISYSNSVSATNSQLINQTYGSWYGVVTSAEEGDIEYLENTDWIDEIGTSSNYGIAYSMMGGLIPLGSATIGTIDNSLENMGIVLAEGSLPQNDGEIAVEIATLNEMQLSSKIGESISLTMIITDDNGISQYVTNTFVLCGIINEYTGLWNVDCALNSIIVTQSDAEKFYSQAGATEIPIESDLFFTVKDGMETGVEYEVNNYLWDTRKSIPARTVTINSATDLESTVTNINTFYIFIILAITLLAVIMIYILQMQSEIRRIVRFRSIGATKGQLRLLIFFETMILCIPAMILGVLLGALGIRAVLALSVYSGSVNIAVSIPWNYLILAVAFWIIGVLAVRMITFQVALATPLTGRMGMQMNKNKLYKNFRRALIMLMATMLCVSVVFTTINIAEPLSKYNYWSSQWSYYIYVGHRHNNYAFALTEEYLNLFSSVTGVTDIVEMTNFPALLTTSNQEVQSVEVVVIDYEDLEKYIDVSDVNEEKYESGDSVIIQIVDDGSELTVPQMDSNVTVSIDYTRMTLNTLGKVDIELSEDSLNSRGLVSVETEVGFSKKVSRNETFASAISYNDADTYNIEDYTYFVICSSSLLQKILDQIPEDQVWNISTLRLYIGQTKADYLEAFIYADPDANGLAIDTSISNIVQSLKPEEYNYTYFKMVNRREINEANAQVYQQSLIMILVSGVCIAVVVLLILVSTLRLETESEKKRYGILQAIGMSKRQRNMELIRKSVVRSVVAIVAAVACYLGYYLIMNISAITAGESALSVLATMFATLAGYGLTVPVLLAILAATFLVTFAICFGTKLSLNRYSLMEMLRND